MEENKVDLVSIFTDNTARFNAAKEKKAYFAARDKFVEEYQHGKNETTLSREYLSEGFY